MAAKPAGTGERALRDFANTLAAWLPDLYPGLVKIVRKQSHPHQSCSAKTLCGRHLVPEPCLYEAVGAPVVKFNLWETAAIPRQVHPNPRAMRKKGNAATNRVESPAMSQRFDSGIGTSMRALSEIGITLY